MIAQICDKCGEMLNIQPGFSDDCKKWTCTRCGFVNKIDRGELYLSEDEYQASLRDPYKGLSDEDVLKLSAYKEIKPVDGREDIILVEEQGSSPCQILSVIYLSISRLSFTVPLFNNCR